MAAPPPTVSSMPTYLHEALLALFRNRPSLAPELAEWLSGVRLPDYDELRPEAAQLSELNPAEYSADLVMLLWRRRPVHALVLEVQLGTDAQKRRSWPFYVTGLRARLDCDVTLLVVAPEPSVATWCATPIETGHPGFALRPLVLGPSAVPQIADPIRACEKPELAVLSAVAHGKSAQGLPIGDAALEAVAASAHLDDAAIRVYIDLILASLQGAARKALEEKMATQHRYQSDFARRYFGAGKDEGKREGKLEGMAAFVLTALEERGFDVPADVRAHVEACQDAQLLDRWHRRAVTASTLEEVFET